MLPANRRVDKEYMMGSTAKEVRLKLLMALKEDERKGKAAILTLYQEDLHLVLSASLPTRRNVEYSMADDGRHYSRGGIKMSDLQSAQPSGLLKL
jgi:hypothetical protein